MSKPQTATTWMTAAAAAAADTAVAAAGGAVDTKHSAVPPPVTPAVTTTTMPSMEGSFVVIVGSGAGDDALPNAYALIKYLRHCGFHGRLSLTHRHSPLIQCADRFDRCRAV